MKNIIVISALLLAIFIAFAIAQEADTTEFMDLSEEVYDAAEEDEETLNFIRESNLANDFSMEQDTLDEDSYQSMDSDGEDANPLFLKKIASGARRAVSAVTNTAKKVVEVVKKPETVIPKSVRTATKYLTAKSPNNVNPPNRERWMQQHYNAIKKLRITQVVLPGTHDAATHRLHVNYVSPDFSISPLRKAQDNQWFKKIRGNLAINSALRPLCETQSYTIGRQLQAGVRFFDLRFCEDVRDKKNPIKVCHGLFGDTIEKVYDEIRSFMDRNRFEVILLQLRIMPGNYNMNSETKKRFSEAMKKLEPYLNGGDWLKQSFEQIVSSNRRILTTNRAFTDTSILRNNGIVKHYPEDKGIINLWPNTDYYQDLQGELTKMINSRFSNFNQINEIQWVLTPSDVGLAARSIKRLNSHIQGGLRNFILNTPKARQFASAIIVDYFENTGVVDLCIQLTLERAR